MVKEPSAAEVANTEALTRMAQQLKKQLKPLSKNELIKIITANLVDLHITRSAYEELLAKTTNEAQAASVPESK